MLQYKIEKVTKNVKKRQPVAPKYDRTEYEVIAKDIYKMAGDRQATVNVPVGVPSEDLVERGNSAGSYWASHDLDRFISRMRAAGRRHEPPFTIRVSYDEQDRKPVRRSDGTVRVMIRRGEILDSVLL